MRVGARLGERQALLVGLAARVRLGDLAVFGAHGLDIGARGVSGDSSAPTTPTARLASLT